MIPGLIFGRCRPWTLCLVVALIAYSMAGTAHAVDRVWTATGEGVQIAVSDCGNCDEDIGMTISCKGPGQPAEVIVQAAAVDLGRENTVRPVTLSVGSESYEYESTTLYMGLLGYIPQFFLSTDDPVLEALQAGSSVEIAYAGRTVTIGLTGSRDALDRFREGCGWEE